MKEEGDDDKAAVSRADSTEGVDCSEIALVIYQNYFE